MERKCKTCRFFKHDDQNLGVGECRELSPHILEDDSHLRIWPKVYVSDWCGDWVVMDERC